MSESVKDYFPYLDYPKPKKKQTNADRIRAMTDEELAKVIAYACDCDLVSGFSCHGGCCDCILDWLKQEVSDGGPIVNVVVKGNCVACGKPLSDEDGVFLCKKCMMEVKGNG